MAEAAFKQMISTLVRQTRAQSIRCGKSPRYPHRRYLSSAAAAQETEVADKPEWQAHTVSAPLHDHVNGHRLQQLRDEPGPRSFSSFLTDSYAREHNYLRISVTERCNLRCLYCMPEEGVELSPPSHLLTTPEIVYLSSVFVNQGVDKIRLTGGEPTVRKDILSLMHQIGNLRSNGLKELCITTNGISLHRKLDSMAEAGLTGVNLSLDTLDPFQFTLMTRRNGHDAVMKSVDRILEMNRLGAGIKLKINCVVMRGMNEREILPFVEMGREQDLEVRFIEYMPFDGNKWSEKKMIGFREMLALIRQKYPDVQKVQDHANDTSKTYKIPGFVGRIGFITSMTHNFCGTCNRLRITGDGNLKVCLFGNSEVSLRDVLRESNDGKPIDTKTMEAIKQLEKDRQQQLPGSTGDLGWSEKESKLLEIIGMAVKRKKEKHAGIGKLENMKNRPMILIDETSAPSRFRWSSPMPPFSAVASTLIDGRSRPAAGMPLLSLNSPSSLAFSQLRPISTISQIQRYPNQKRFRWIVPARDVESARPHKVLGMGTYRTIPTHEPETRPAFSKLSWRPQSQPNNNNLQAHTLAHSYKWRRLSLETATDHGTKIQDAAPENSQPQAAQSSANAMPTYRRILVQEFQPTQKAQMRDMSTSFSRLLTEKSGEVTDSGEESLPQAGSDVKHDQRATLKPENMTSADQEGGPAQQNEASQAAGSSQPSASSAATGLTHLNSLGEVHMVSIAHKRSTFRSATAVATLVFSHPGTYHALRGAQLHKGDAMAVARVAGIQAAKKTADLIPLAHPGLGITGVKVVLHPFCGPTAKPAPGESDRQSPGPESDAIYSNPSPPETASTPSRRALANQSGVSITATVSCEGKTGVEMEAMTAATVAGLTMYDMLKGVDNSLMLTTARVISKRGGKNGDYTWNYNDNRLELERLHWADELNDQAQTVREERVRKNVEEGQNMPARVMKADLRAERDKRFVEWQSR